VLSDPRALAALAHPARVKIIDELYAGESRTATELAKLVGLSPSATSYHLRALEKWGIVRRAQGRRDERQRPWIRASKSLSWSGDAGSQRVLDAITAQHLDRLRRDFIWWSRSRDLFPPEWRTAAISRGFPFLTPDEIERLNEVVSQAVMDIAQDRTEQNRPPASRRVAYFWATVPVADTRESPRPRAAEDLA
jgi:DNA-binding transcriptional ArsR family regulator